MTIENVCRLDQETVKRMYFTMYEIRAFEENINKFYQKGISYGGLHLAIGEEAVAVGSMFPLKKEDKIVTYHRGHGHTIAKGADVKRMLAELRAKATGYCKGRGGSVHLLDMECGQMGCQGIVGAQSTVATGVALADRIKGEPGITVCLFGDGAAEQGQVHEGMNLAGVLKLPILFICVNNGYAVSTPAGYSCSAENIADRAVGYGMKGYQVDGNDVFAVYDTISKVAEDIRNGSGPAFVELVTYRIHGHWAGDPAYYRTKEEVESWKMTKDPINLLKNYILSENIASEDELEALRKKADALIQEANEFVEASPEPSWDEMVSDIYYKGEE